MSGSIRTGLLVTACLKAAYALAWGSLHPILFGWPLRVRSDKGAAITAKLGING